MLGFRWIETVAAGMLALWPASIAAQTPPAAPSQDASQPVLVAPIEVVGTSPLPGVGMDRDKISCISRSFPPPDISTVGSAGICVGI